MANPYPITPRQLDLDKLSGSSLKVTGSYPNIQLDVNFSGSPTSLSGSTSNNPGNSNYPSTMNHTHVIQSSDNPGSQSYITKTNSQGGITLQKIGLGISGSPFYDFEVDSDMTFVGSHTIETTSDGLTLAPASDLDLTPGGTARVRATSGVRLQSDNYASQTTGWGISYNGSGDFRYLYSDELHAKAFVADLEQALAGGQIISKSVAPLYNDFTVPDYSTSASMIVESFVGFDTFKVFEDGDFVRVREFDRVSGSLNITNCWGQVYWISTDTTDKFQTYEFTRSASPNGGLSASGTVIPKGVLVLDYGYIGNGVIESTAIDGAMAENSPYTQITNWTGHPAQKDGQLAIGDMAIGSTFVVGGSQVGEVVRTRTGNLKGIFNASNEFGFYAGDGFRNNNSFLRVSSCVVEAHNLPINLYDENAKTISLDPNSPSFAMGSTLPSSYTVGNGLWMGKDNDVYKFRVGDPRYNMLDWDGSDLYIRSNPTDYMKSSGLGIGFYLDNVERLSLSSDGNLTINDSAGNAVITLDSTEGAEITNELTLSGLNSALSIGETPPSDSSTGTGIWMDRTGLYTLNSDSEQIRIDATNGGLYAGEGNVLFDGDGLTLFGDTDTYLSSRSVSWKGVDSSPIGYIMGWEGTSQVGLTIEALNNNDSKHGVIILQTEGDFVTDNSFTTLIINPEVGITISSSGEAKGQLLLGGSVSLPALADTGWVHNTGIYFPAIGQIGFSVLGSNRMTIGSNKLGFNGSAAISKPTVTGSRGGNAALASLLTALENYGLITNSTT